MSLGWRPVPTNPIMKEQISWDDAVFHNFTYKETSYVPRRSKIQENKTTDQPIMNIIDLDKIICWILPTEIQTTIDPVFGQQTQRMIWGIKFTIEIEIREQNDLLALFWTKEITSLNRGSILFINARHWKCQETSNLEDGLLIKCIASEQTPNFSNFSYFP